MKFTMPTPDELAKLSKAEIATLTEQAGKEITAFRALLDAGHEFSPDDVERFEYLAESAETLDSRAAELTEAETTSADKLKGLMERTAPKAVEPEPTPEPEPEPEPAPEAAAPEAPAPEAAPEAPAPVAAAPAPAPAPAPVPVAAAAAAPVSFAAGTQSSAPDPEGDGPEPWNLLPSAPNYAQYHGKKVTLADVALSMAGVDPGSGQGVQPTGTAGPGMAKQSIATLTRPQVTLEAKSEQEVYEFLRKLGKEIPGKGKADAEGLTAAGGWCSPSQQLYGFCDVPPATGTISLPDFPFDMSRGGVRVPVNPDISELLTDLWHFTESQLQAVDSGGDPAAVKPIIELPCPDEFLEWRLEAIGWAAKAGILQRQAWPEAIENALQQIQVAHQYRVSQLTIGKMVAGSGAAKVFPTDQVIGATSGALNALAWNAQNLRIDKGLPDTATIEAVGPSWAREIFRADLAMRDGKDALAVTNAEIDSWFTARGIYVQYVRAWQAGGAGEPGDLDNQLYPESVDFLMYPAGTWFRQLQNVITIGVQYPLELLQLNQYSHIFTEDSFQVGKRCNESILVTVPLCVNGAVGARESIVCGS